MPIFLLLGDYSGNNTGHNALLLAVIEELSSVAQCKFLVPTVRPSLLNHVLANDDRVEIIGIAPWNLSLKFLGIPTWKAIKKSDCILLTDNLFYDSDFLNPFKNNLIALLFVVFCARKLSKPLIYYNAAVGPVVSRLAKMCIKWIAARVDLITLRDVQSKIILDEIASGVNSLITADSGFHISKHQYRSGAKKQMNLENDLSSIQESIGINVSYHFMNWTKYKTKIDITRDKIRMNFTETVRQILHRTSHGITFFITHPQDKKLTVSIAEMFKRDERVKIIDCSNYPLPSVFEMISGLSCLIGTRYHEMVMTAALGVPVIGFNCGEKMLPLLELLGLRQFLIEPEYIFSQEDRERIVNYVKSACNIKKEFQERLRDIRKCAEKSADIIVARGYVRGYE